MTDQEAKIVVEFFGLARHRAGKSSAEFTTNQAGMRWRELADQLALRFPELIGEPTDSVEAKYLVNLNGHQFINDPETQVRAGERIIIMSPDAGG